ncbi:hypothetical protein ACQUD0_11130 [Vagococcus fluvialis]|uniref:hypothetical protein n=1 Tax=Lactobacillales TaxID=186826 RepID=UPI0035A1BD16
MQKSATTLGSEYGLNAQEMNRILVKNGVLEGSTDNYSLTEKGRPFAVEKHHHRGTGGYNTYNRYWTTRTYDDSIKENLDVSLELIQEVREEMAADRIEKKLQEEAGFLAQQASEEAMQAAKKRAVEEEAKIIAKWKKAGMIGLFVGGALIVGYGVYKATPHIKKWWNDRKSAGTTKKDECTNCGKTNDPNGIVES